MKTGEAIRKITRKLETEISDVHGYASSDLTHYARNLALEIYDMLETASSYDADLQKAIDHFTNAPTVG